MAVLRGTYPIVCFSMRGADVAARVMTDSKAGRGAGMCPGAGRQRATRSCKRDHEGWERIDKLVNMCLQTLKTKADKRLANGRCKGRAGVYPSFDVWDSSNEAFHDRDHQKPTPRRARYATIEGGRKATPGSETAGVFWGYTQTHDQRTEAQRLAQIRDGLSAKFYPKSSACSACPKTSGRTVQCLDLDP